MKELKYTITDPEGLHARPAGQLAKIAAGFLSDIRLTYGEKSADAKRIFAIMGMAVKKDAIISLTIEGEDEEAAYAAISAFLSENL